MTRSIRDPLPPGILARQRQAANPDASIWVEANAGSGKTHVLTERVLRLLLSGVAPESILCLTYTKAAAAEMRSRVSRRLARWALLDDVTLAGELEAMEARRPEPKLLARARTLFAHALETPGGLKIVTIHAFCESVLHRFPLEARVPFDFTVVEESERDQMVMRAQESVLSRGLRGDQRVAEAVATLFDLISDYSINDAIATALMEGRKLRPVLADRDGAKRRLRRLVGAPDGETRASIGARALAGALFAPERYAELFAHLPPDTAKTKNLNFCERLYRLRSRPVTAEALFEAYLTEGKARSDRCISRIKDGDLAAAIGDEHDRLATLYPLYLRATLVERSEALLDVLGAIHDAYEEEKRGRSLLDFDDLIARVRELFANDAIGLWVQYKLDAGITHILVDESQDTNPEQWATVRAIAREFFVGESAVERPRTLFAVGDEKQSIYSFQGADPTLFRASGNEFAARAQDIGRAFEFVRLQTSFRTLPDILEAVDKVFARDDIREAALAPPDFPVHHETARREPGGTVTLWPPIKQQGDDAPDGEWPLQPVQSLQTAPRQVAERIAGEIRGWIASRRPLGPRGRPVTPSDILILVQTRSALFHEIIRALNRLGLPTPGADRLAVTTHIAVLDLLALGDVLLNPADDLQLAALLRSPLFDIGEDELFAILSGRRGTAWQALEQSPLPSAREAWERLTRWRGRLDFERPFEFFTEVLYAQEGLRRFHTRLGPEVDDVLAEFLALALEHEQSAQPSLQGLLASLRTREVSIKRELAESGGGIRVMTVHGAKGLEAPIVILADAASKPEGQQLNKPVYVLDEAPGPLLIHASGRKDHVPATFEIKQRHETAQGQEYWRKLYVGMTRAEDELYITGALTKTGKVEGTWYEAIETTLRDESEIVQDEDGGERALIYPRERPGYDEARVSGGPASNPGLPLELPPLPEPPMPAIVRPSSAYGGAQRGWVLETALEAGADADAARREGLALHALLQHLGRVAPAARLAVASKAMPVLLPEAPERHEAMATKAMGILANPGFGFLFGDNSRPEVPFLARGTRDGKPVTLAGRFDRIVVEVRRVLVVDYKSDARPPTRPEEVSENYLVQLGLYARVAGQLFPGREIEAGILWTTLESLMFLPAEQLRRATANFTIR